VGWALWGRRVEGASPHAARWQRPSPWRPPTHPATRLNTPPRTPRPHRALVAARHADYLIGVGSSSVSVLVAQLMGASRRAGGDAFAVWQEDVLGINPPAWD
jgi:hypothetical protein